jgi:DNA-binding transcriptional regulator YdaS (Cro superfamily)
MSLMDEVFEKAGGRQVLQDKLHLSKQTMSDWKRWGRVPANHAVAVESLTGIPREKLCPQFEWGRDVAKSSKAKAKA